MVIGRALGEMSLARWDSDLADFDAAYAATYPGPAGPGPVHTVYVPVPLFGPGVIASWGAEGLAAVGEFEPEWNTVVAELPGMVDESAAKGLTERTRAKLAERADRGSAHRFRGRVPGPPGQRRGRSG